MTSGGVPHCFPHSSLYVSVFCTYCAVQLYEPMLEGFHDSKPTMLCSEPLSGYVNFNEETV